MRYRSKVDAWLIWLLVLAALPPFWVAYEGWRVGHSQLILTGLVPALTLIFVYPTEYWFDHDSLYARGGVIRYTIKLSQITAVERTRDLTSAPALSLDRLRVVTPTLRLLISPADAGAFLDDLEQRASHLKGKLPR